MNKEQKNWIICKFGGTSVADLQSWQTIAKIVKSHLENNLHPVIVCSALSGISNQLEQLLELAIDNQHEALLNEICNCYREFSQTLDLDPQEYIEKYLADLSRLATGISLVKEISPRIKAQIMSLGETMLTALGTAYG